jgi:hypothetical protein
MTIVQWANLTSSILGAVGTTLLFFFSYTDLPSGMFFWSSRGNTKHTQQVGEKIRDGRYCEWLVSVS